MAASVTPFLMFTGAAEEAMRFYVAIFPHAEILRLEKYGAGEPGAEGSVKRADFVVCGQKILCIDSPVPHAFGFTPAVSLFVECDTGPEQEELFQQLSTQGKVLMPLANSGFSTRFAWVDDRFGVSWQLNLK